MKVNLSVSRKVRAGAGPFLNMEAEKGLKRQASTNGCFQK